jgi:uncharacterized membrane protein YhaH (DUF805 family)
MDWRTLFFSFRGRLNRAKYWLVFLINAVISAVCISIFAVLMNGLRMGIYGGGMMAVIALITIILIAIFWSSLALAFRRLHDRNKSGVWLLLFWLAPSVLNAIGQSIGATGAGLFVALVALRLRSGDLSRSPAWRGRPDRTTTDPTRSQADDRDRSAVVS